MARKYPRKNRKKLKWFDPFNRNKPLEVFADSDNESPSKVSGLSKKKKHRTAQKTSKTSLEQEVPRNFKLFMKGIQIHEDDEKKKEEAKKKLLFTPVGKNVAKELNRRKSRKISSLEQWRIDSRQERKEDKELDHAEKEYFKDSFQLNERVDAPPSELKTPVCKFKSRPFQTVTPMKSISLSAKKLISSVKSDVKFKRRKPDSKITTVMPTDSNADELSQERERVVKAYRELKWSKTRAAALMKMDTQSMTPVEI
ncbi:coiled-coil domain-containing protein 137-like [Symsagittifera roscoffensis]|uniref:coiled-coil domain-containing protein 137-like n=1 Tax=Symsagittifera roscoffensis TaxID=84072 RepID=UPI00307C6401